ncbi:unnamed protein product [Durusdinium trenchii]
MLILFRQDILTGSTETAAKGLAVTCHGQGLGFRQVQEKAPNSETLLAAFRELESLPKLQEESVVLVCRDGRSMSAALAVAWLTLRCGQSLDSSVDAVVESAKQVGAIRCPLEAFENREAFAAALSKVHEP